MDKIEFVTERFEVLVEWKIRHEYYREGICRCVELVADEATKVLLKRRDVKLKRLEKNVWGLIGTGKVSWDEEDEVVLEVKVKDPFWDFYTEERLPERLSWSPGGERVIEMECRSKQLRWEYVLLMREWREERMLELKEGEGRLTFEKEGTVVMNGMKGVRLVSAETVILRERYDYRLRLSERRPLGNKLIAREVVFPEPGRFPECGEKCLRAVIVV